MTEQYTPTTDDLRKIAENATPGPWKAVPHAWGVGVDAGEEHSLFIETYGVTFTPNPADAMHVATFNPETVLALLNRVETAEQAIARVRELHQWNRVDQYDDRLGDWVEEYCTGCHEVWPCATIRALEGDDEN